ncbi:MAG: leucyl/phenylalanyl-tRNA--protein transferase [Hyphomonadaceae bacterium]|nr:leucyl/phenylalanyl-tRNA--protein transferase [Hyphomonadaceae bacterium]
MKRFTADDLLRCYRRGVFPMAESRDDADFFVVDPEARAILPLDAFHVPRRLARTVRSDAYRIAIDEDFLGVIDACAAPQPGRQDTWINPTIRSLYDELHARGHAHSLEVRARQDGALLGGLYGVAVGGAFFGESMFSRARDASKVALVHLVARLIVGGFALLDAQFLTGHLEQFGAVAVARRDFHVLLAHALARRADFLRMQDVSGAQALQSIAQTS